MPATVSSQLINVTTGEAVEVTDGTPVVVGRDLDAQLVLADADCSRRQFQISRSDGGFVLTNLSNRVTTYCDGRAVTSPVPLRCGMQIAAGASKLLFQQASQSPDDEHAQTHFGSLNDYAIPDAGFLKRAMADGEAIEIGRDASCDVPLSHIQVSWRHAQVRRTSSTGFVEDLGSSNGTYVDGKRITMPQPLRPGSSIVIGPYTFYFTGSGITSQPRSNNLQLEANKLSVSVPNLDAEGTSKVILDAVSVVIRPHQFVCLIGPSGSGKSTLLGALSARNPAQHGRVLLNQLDLYENFASLKGDIAVVAQRDVLHEELPLEEALRFTAKLRLPTDTSDAEIAARIDELLKQVGLTGQRQTVLARLSGGQRRRASLASELISNPSVLFLDEVTSGLDERTDRELMQLFRRLADSGKTVVCVTHTLANLEETCHQVVVLGVGGKLAFSGSPESARKFFGATRMADFYEALEHPLSAGDLQQRFLESPDYDRNVSSLLSPTSQFVAEAKAVHKEPQWRGMLNTAGHQLPILLQRYYRVFFADRRSLTGILAQVIVVATVLWLVFGDLDALGGSQPDQLVQQALRASQVLFVLGISCFWFGCNNSVKEIVRERAIYTRELQVNLDPVSYYASKLILQATVSGLQSLVLLWIVGSWCSLPGDQSWQALLLMLAATSGVAVGLALSTAATTDALALTLVPLVLIPQIILSDMFVELSGVSEWLGGLFVTNQWIYGMLRGSLPESLQDASRGLVAAPRSAALGLTVIAGQMLVLMLGAIAVLHVRDRVLAGSNKPLRIVVEQWLHKWGLIGIKS